MPTRRRSAVCRSSRCIDGNRRATRRRAPSHSSCGSTSSSAAAATSRSTPLFCSSARSARRARPRPAWRELTQARANAASSMRPTSVNRSRTAVAASSGTPRLASRSASCLRVLAAPVSARRQIARATASGLPRSSSPGPGAASRVRGTSAEAVRDRRPRPRGGGRRSSVSSRSLTDCSEVGRSGLGGRVEGGADAELLLDLLLDLVGEVGVVAQEGADVLLALAELVALVRVPGAGLADEALLDPGVDEAALATEAGAPQEVELGLLERRGHLVLDDLDADPAADRLGALLEGLDATDVEPDRRVELQRAATGGDLGRAVDDADLLAQLVDEDRGGAGVVQRTSDLAQRLAHQAGLQTDVAVAHLALDLGARHER